MFLKSIMSEVDIRDHWFYDLLRLFTPITKPIKITITITNYISDHTRRQCHSVYSKRAAAVVSSAALNV